MKKFLKKFLKRNIILIIFTVVLSIITISFYINSRKVIAYFKYKNEIEKSISKNHETRLCNFSKLESIKTKQGNYILVDNEKNARDYDLISKNEIGSYEYDIQGKIFHYYPESLEKQRNKIIKKYEYKVYNLDKKKITQRINLKKLLNKYCKDYYWNNYNLLKSEVVYGADGKTYVTAGCVNPTQCKLDNSYELYNESFYNNFYQEKGILKDILYDKYAISRLTYGGLYVSLDQKYIVRALMYLGDNCRNVFQNVSGCACKLDSRDVNYNFMYNEINYAKDFYSNRKEYENSYVVDKIKKTNGIELEMKRSYTNPFCKVKIEFNSSALKSNMTNLFNKYPELKKYVGVKGKKITLFDHDLENDDQVLQLFTPDGKPLSFAGVKDDKVGEITGVADYCQKMKKYYENQKTKK